MRALLLGLAGLSLSVATLDCFSESCEETLTCGNPYDGGNADTTTKDSGPDGPPVSCPSGKEPKDDPTCVTNDVGIFVSAAGNDADLGTKEKPLATLGAALTKAGTASKGKIFVCEGNYTESVEIKATVGVYGGFKCADWTYSGTKPKVTATKPDFVLQVSGADGVTLTDLELVAEAATANSGRTSVGLLISVAQGVVVTRDKVSAAAGGTGSNGVLTPFTYPTQPELDGNSADGGTAGLAKSVTCPGGKSSVGGKGGDGAGGDGDNGAPAADGGVKGLGGAQSIPCLSGGDGTSGTSGKDGDKPSALGTITSSGWQPSSGTAGVPGDVGQGGGGGGGRTVSAVPGGGGSGGGGGCGGAGGARGGGGGASIAIVVFNAVVTVYDSELISANGGAGGNGSGAQPGQTPGGFPGAGKASGCNGGNGGAGGVGGTGAGGAGGLSVGILYKGTKPTTDAATDSKITFGAKGTKGLGGSTPTNDGIDGVAQAVLQVP